MVRSTSSISASHRLYPDSPGLEAGNPVTGMVDTMQASLGFRDVHAYPSRHLCLTLTGVCVPVSYQKTWNDGFGARGWKLDVANTDPAITASTRETGGRIPTSVLIHDLLDHLLSGFDISGHRAEAMALVQLGKRTGSDVRRDYLQMVHEDLHYGRVNHESLTSFLPQTLIANVPLDEQPVGQELIQALQAQLGKEQLDEQLVQYFMDLGERGNSHAQGSWRMLGLKSSRCQEIGLALQRVLIEVDQRVESKGVEQLNATFVISNERCALEIYNAADSGLRKRYNSSVG